MSPSRFYFQLKLGARGSRRHSPLSQGAITVCEKIGLVGHSGAGKSSLVNLLLRYFKNNKGKILIDGQNITGVTQDSLRENIAVIPQDTLLFHRTLMENIRYGKPTATDKEVIQDSKRAHLH